MPDRRPPALVVLATLASGCTSSAGSADACAIEEVLDGDTCVPEACAAGTWGALPVADDTVYVSADAAAGGDGSEERPFTSIQAGADALAGRGSGLVAVASGRYAEALVLGSRHDGITVAGRCAAGVTLDGGGRNDVVVRVARDGRDTRPRVALMNLTVTGGDGGGVSVIAAELEGSNLRIEDNGTQGLYLERATTLLTDTTIARVRRRNGYGSGIATTNGASLELRGVTIEDTEDGIYADTIDRLALRDVRLRRTASGPCVVAVDVDSVDGENVLMDDCAAGGVYVIEQTTASFRDLTIQGTRRIDADSGYGLTVAAGAHVEVEGLSVTGSDVYGAYVINGDSSLEVRGGELSANLGYGLHVVEGRRAAGEAVPNVRLSDVRIADNLFDGVATIDGMQLRAERVEVRGNGNMGMQFWNEDPAGEPTEVTLKDVTIAGTLSVDPSVAPAPGGYGMYVKGDVQVHGDDVVIEENHILGIGLEYGATLSLEDCVISDQLPHTDGSSGWGAQATLGSHLRLERCDLERNHSVGVKVTDAGTEAELIDVRVRDTLRSEEPTLAATGGSGVRVNDGATAVLTRATLEGNPTQGLVVSGAGAHADVTESVIRGTYATTAGTHGRGATVARGGSLRMSRSMLSDNVDVGALAHGAGSRLELSSSVIEGTRIGRQGRIAFGMATAARGSLVATDVEVRGTEGAGAYAYFEGSLAMERAHVHDNTFAGVAVIGGATVEVLDSRIVDNVPDPDVGGGVGILTRNLSGAQSVHVDGTEIGPHPYAALWFDGPGTYTVEDARLAGGTGVTLAGVTLHGNALVAVRGVQARAAATSGGLLLTGTKLYDALGPAVLLDGSSMTQEGNVWAGNARDLLQQRCGDLPPLTTEEVADVPTPLVCPQEAMLIDTSLRVLDYGPSEPVLSE